MQPPITVLNSSEFVRFRMRSYTVYCSRQSGDCAAGTATLGPGVNEPVVGLLRHSAFVLHACKQPAFPVPPTLSTPLRPPDVTTPQPASRARTASSRSCPQPQPSAPTPTTTWCTTASTQPPTTTSTLACTACCRGCRCCGCCRGRRPKHVPCVPHPPAWGANRGLCLLLLHYCCISFIH